MFTGSEDASRQLKPRFILWQNYKGMKEFRVDQFFSLESKPASYNSEKDVEPCRETLASERAKPELEGFPLSESTARHR